MWWPHLFPRESPGRTQEVWPRHKNKSRASAVALEIAMACSFSPLTAVAVARAASYGTQRASPVNAHISTCQNDGADLPPANLSSPGV